MQEVGQRIDHGNAAVPRQLLHIAVGIGSNHQAVDKARQDARRVGDRFTAAEMQVVLVQEERMTPQFMNADFERDAGARAGLGEDQRPSLLREHRSIPAARPLELPGEREDFGHLLRLEVRLLEEVLHGRKKVVSTTAPRRRPEENGPASRSGRAVPPTKVTASASRPLSSNLPRGQATWSPSPPCAADRSRVRRSDRDAFQRGFWLVSAPNSTRSRSPRGPGRPRPSPGTSSASSTTGYVRAAW